MEADKVSVSVEWKVESLISVTKAEFLVGVHWVGAYLEASIPHDASVEERCLHGVTKPGAAVETRIMYRPLTIELQ